MSFGGRRSAFSMVMGEGSRFIRFGANKREQKCSLDYMDLCGLIVNSSLATGGGVKVQGWVSQEWEGRFVSLRTEKPKG